MSSTQSKPLVIMPYEPDGPVNYYFHPTAGLGYDMSLSGTIRNDSVRFRIIRSDDSLCLFSSTNPSRMHVNFQSRQNIRARFHFHVPKQGGGWEYNELFDVVNNDQVTYDCNFTCDHIDVEVVGISDYVRDFNFPELSFSALDIVAGGGDAAKAEDTEISETVLVSQR